MSTSMPAAPLLRLTASQAAVALSELTTCSISFSYIAFFGSFRSRLPGCSAPDVRRGFTASPSVSRSGLGDRSCRRPPFRTLWPPARLLFSFVPSFFGPSLTRLSPGFFRYYGLC